MLSVAFQGTEKAIAKTDAPVLYFLFMTKEKASPFSELDQAVGMGDNMQSFQKSIEGYHDWPCKYLFKFIVPEQKKDEVLGLFESRDEVSMKKSRNGRYISITARCLVNCSEEVVLVYQAAARINGVIPL